NGFVELKLHNKVDVFSKKFIKNQREVETLEARAYLFSLIPIRAIEMVAILSIVSIFLYTLFLQDNSENLIVIIGLFAAAAYRLMPSINRVLNSLNSLKQASVTINQLKQFRKFE